MGEEISNNELQELREDKKEGSFIKRYAIPTMMSLLGSLVIGLVIWCYNFADGVSKDRAEHGKHDVEVEAQLKALETKIETMAATANAQNAAKIKAVEVKQSETESDVADMQQLMEKIKDDHGTRITHLEDWNSFHKK